MTICNQWAWKPDDPMKSLKQCLQTLVCCAGGDGNLLFNVGPMPTARSSRARSSGSRRWARGWPSTARAIYGTRGGPFKPNRASGQHAQGQHDLRPRAEVGRRPITLPAAAEEDRRAVACSPAARRRSSRTASGITISVPAPDRQEIDTIVKLELDGPALDIRPVSLPTNIKATASNVFQQMDEYAPEMAFDGDPHTRWATDGGTKQAWIAIDLGKPVTLEGVKIQEEFPGRVEKFELQYKDGAEWKTILSGTKLGHFSQKFPPVTAQHVRLNILEANEGPTIAEIQWMAEPESK